MSQHYKFNIVCHSRQEAMEQDWIQNRPLIQYTKELEKGAKYFVPNEALEVAINTTIAIGDPLLVTGEPGTGKTQIAYYIAHKLNIDIIHFSVKSTSKAQNLLYDFDTVKYFRDAHITKECEQELQKEKYIQKGPLWKSMIASKPVVLLVDEIDKAPRDFPNDLLHELDQMSIYVAEIDKLIKLQDRKNYPIVVITSNSERRLPEPFLRRCIYHYIEFDQEVLKKAIKARHHEYSVLSDEFIAFAIDRFIGIRNKHLRKTVSTSELLIWLRVVSVAVRAGTQSLEQIVKLPLAQMPFLGALIKDSEDLKEIGSE